MKALKRLLFVARLVGGFSLSIFGFFIIGALLTLPLGLFWILTGNETLKKIAEWWFEMTDKVFWANTYES